MNAKTRIDPTNRRLDAALLDQTVAGMLAGRDYAYVPVVADGDRWGAGIAVANESGFHPIASEAFLWDDLTPCEEFCDGMNAHIGLSEDRATEIVISTMGGRSYRRAR